MKDFLENINKIFANNIPMVFYTHDDCSTYTIVTHAKDDMSFMSLLLNSSIEWGGSLSTSPLSTSFGPFALPTHFLDMVHPCDVDRMQETLETARRTKQSYKTVFILKANDSRDRFIFNSAVYTQSTDGRGYFMGILMDINDLSSQQEALLLQRSAYFDSQAYKHALVGDSLALHALKARLSKVGPSDAFALLLGESGVGKELAARTIHETSPRSHKPFVPVNCGAIPENLMESMFFGHVRGAFSGAAQAHEGFFTQAQGGTLFLDEIGELPLSMQIKLLRVLDGSPYTPVGGSQLITPDFRLIGATNRNLEESVTRGEFRADFLFRINVLPITIPPLRERKEDIPLLIRYFLHEYPSAPPIPGLMLERLMRYQWLGNIRELRNAITHYAVFGAFPDYIMQTCQTAVCPFQACYTDDLREVMRDFEKKHIQQVLRKTKGNRSAAAKLLGIDRRTLFEKLRIYE